MATVPDMRIPAATRLRVRINEPLNTKRNRTNDGFSAVLETPVAVGDQVALPQGTLFHGHILASRSSGHLKGRAELSLVLDEVELGGVRYPIDTRSNVRVSRGHKKRNWGWISGGSGVGAAIGAMAGGGAGALIGAGAGAAAGTGVAVLTGKKNVSIPAETLLTFALRDALTIPVANSVTWLGKPYANSSPSSRRPRRSVSSFSFRSRCSRSPILSRGR